MHQLLCLPAELRDQLDYISALKSIQGSFENPAEFTFFVSGPFGKDKEAIISLLEKYLGTLPTAQPVFTVRVESSINDDNFV